MISVKGFAREVAKNKELRSLRLLTEEEFEIRREALFDGLAAELNGLSGMDEALLQMAALLRDGVIDEDDARYIKGRLGKVKGKCGETYTGHDSGSDGDSTFDGGDGEAFKSGRSGGAGRLVKPRAKRATIIAAGVLVVSCGASFAAKTDEIRYAYLVNRGAISIQADRLDDARRFYMDAQSITGGDEGFQENCSDWLSKIYRLKASKESFDTGRSLYGEGLYMEAMRSFSGVSQEDEKRYADSRRLIDEAKPQLVSELSLSYKDRFSAKDYQGARQIANDLALLGEDMSAELRQLDLLDQYVEYETCMDAELYDQAYEALDILDGMGEDVDDEYSKVDDAKVSHFRNTFEGLNYRVDSYEFNRVFFTISKDSRLTYNRGKDAYFGRNGDNVRLRLERVSRESGPAFDYYEDPDGDGKFDYVGTYSK
jgi:hypothetical protein